jgi:tripartite-type tricarboxylate transporter receptor subunit TctC
MSYFSKAIIKRYATVVTAAFFMTGLTTIAAAGPENYPNRPVTIIVPFTPGSSTDNVARLLAAALEPILKQPIIVDNRAGGTGSVGAGLVAAAEPDGYTLLLGSNSTQTANPLLIKNLSYDPAKDFRSIAMLSTFEALLVVNPKLPVKTAEELVAYIRANPGKVTYGTGSVTSAVWGAIFMKQLSLDALRVPFKSNPDALTSLLSGQVDIMFPDIGSSASQVRAGTVRALASITLGEVTPLAPDLKPLSQTLVPELKMVAFTALFAPAKTPEDTVKKLADAVKQVTSQPGFKDKIHSIGGNANVLDAAELDEYMRNERITFAKMFKEVGMSPQ